MIPPSNPNSGPVAWWQGTLLELGRPGVRFPAGPSIFSLPTGDWRARRKVPTNVSILNSKFLICALSDQVWILFHFGSKGFGLFTRDFEKRCRNVEMPIERVDVTWQRMMFHPRGGVHAVSVTSERPERSGPSTVNDEQASY